MAATRCVAAGWGGRRARPPGGKRESSIGHCKRTRLKPALACRLALSIQLALLWLAPVTPNQAGGGVRAGTVMATAANQPQATHPAAHLPKLGLVRGLKFGSTGSGVGGGGADKSKPDDGLLQSSATAVFLGLPYAAPPTGPLRFMPPGAVRPSQRQTANGGDQCQLLSSGVARGTTTPSRSFVKFGAECVQLADWLAAPVAGRALHQSEDCLNMNLFVPYEPTATAAATDQPKRTARSNKPAERTGRQDEGKLVTDDSQLQAIAQHQLQAQESGAEVAESAQVEQEAPGSSDERHSRSTNGKSIRPNELAPAQAAPPDQVDQTTPTACHLELIVHGTAGRVGRRPVLVLFHSQANWAPSQAETATSSDRKANSLAFVELAQRTGAIVVTFNYRIGLLGYLPYADQLEEFQRAFSAPGAASSANQARHNHAIWDQLGLLHWLKHNIANLNGDPQNITLASTDNKSAKLLQMLAMSPISRGLFQRLLLVHDQQRQAGGANEMADGQDEYLGQLLHSAMGAREPRRKLFNEMGLIVRRLAVAGEKPAGQQTASNSNLELDRNVFEFLRTANLSQLASLEAQLAGLRLLQLVAEPNLDDPMLFPYFAQLIRSSQFKRPGGERSNWPLEGRVEAGDKLFWSALRVAPDASVAANQTGALWSPWSAGRMELDYCLYLGRLHKGLAEAAAVNRPLKQLDLDHLDPLRLLPRLSERHPPANQTNGARRPAHSKTQPWLSPWSWFRSADGQAGGEPIEVGELNANDSRLWPARPTNGNKWTQSRLVSAAQFFHLRHAHLLSRLLGEVGAESKRSGTARGADGEEEEDDDEEEEEEEDGALHKRQRSVMLMQQRQQRGAPSAPHQSAAEGRTRRDTALGQLDALGGQLGELLGSHDLLLGFIGRPLMRRGPTNETPGPGRGSEQRGTLADTLLNLAERNGLQLDNQFSFWLQLADLHFLASAWRAHPNELERSSGGGGWPQDQNEAYNGNNCDFISADMRRIKWQRRQPGDSPEQYEPNERAASARARSTYAFVADLHSAPSAEPAEPWILNTNRGLLEALANFVHTGRPTRESGPAAQWPRYDTLNRRVKLIADEGAQPTSRSEALDGGELGEQIDLHLQLLPYVDRVDEARNGAAMGQFVQLPAADELGGRLSRPPSELAACLGYLVESKLNQTRRDAPAAVGSSGWLADELQCLGRETKRLRGHLQLGAAKELEPLVMLLADSANLLQQAPVSNNTHSSIDSQSQRLAPLNTRNLANQSEGIYLDQRQAGEQPFGLNVRLNDQSIEARAQAGANSNATTQLLLIPAEPPGQSNSTANTAATLRGFFAKTYRDAMGQALGIVIGTGALIFLLNLAIVLVIALRSARNNRQQAGAKRRAGVQDVGQDLDQIQAPGAALGLLEQGQFQHSIGANGLLLGRDEGARQLTSSFKQQPDAFEADSARKRSVKSIKFDLSAGGGGGGHVDKWASDEGRQNERQISSQMAPHAPRKHCVIHGVRQQAGSGGEDSDGLASKQQEANASPSYLLNEFSNKLELDQLNAAKQEQVYQSYVAQNARQQRQQQFQMQFQQLPDHNGAQSLYGFHLEPAGSNTSQPPSDDSCPNQAHHHQHHHHVNRSLGSSSLTSPFASQSTPASNGGASSASTTIYTIQPARVQQGGLLLQSFDPAGLCQGDILLATNQQTLYSPASSTTMSSGTPAPAAPERRQPGGGCRLHSAQSGLFGQDSSPSQALDRGPHKNSSYLLYELDSTQRMLQADEGGRQQQQQQQMFQDALDPSSVRLLIMPTEDDG